MPILKEIKISRLMFAVVVTMLIADTAPHPNLSAGLLESSWHHMASSWMDDSALQTAVTP